MILRFVMSSVWVCFWPCKRVFCGRLHPVWIHHSYHQQRCVCWSEQPLPRRLPSSSSVCRPETQTHIGEVFLLLLLILRCPAAGAQYLQSLQALFLVSGQLLRALQPLWRLSLHLEAQLSHHHVILVHLRHTHTEWGHAHKQHQCLDAGASVPWVCPSRLSSLLSGFCGPEGSGWISIPDPVSPWAPAPPPSASDAHAEKIKSGSVKVKFNNPPNSTTITITTRNDIAGITFRPFSPADE